MKKIGQKRPMDVQEFNEICRLQSDNFPREEGKWSIFLGEDNISIHSPNGGGWTIIPKDQFNDMVKWYTTPQPFIEVVPHG